MGQLPARCTLCRPLGRGPAFVSVFPVILIATLLLPRLGAAQASVHLQPMDAVHRDLDRLAAWGLIDTMLVGQRPYSRAQAARLTARAVRGRERLGDQSPVAPTADRALARLNEWLAPELAQLGIFTERAGDTPLLGEARLDATWTDSPPRDVPSSGAGGTSAARLNPMLAYDLGRSLQEGTTVGFELEFARTLGARIAGTVRPRAQIALPSAGSSRTTVELQAGHARLLLGNAALTLGRDHVVWGQAPQGGLVLSSNPGSLLLVSLATEHPVVLPGPFAWLGPSRYQLFLADLGTEAQRFAHSKLFGGRLSFLPHRRLEMGAQFLVESGGDGAPEASLGDLILDHLFFPDLFTKREFLFSNKVAGLDVRLRVPEARGLELWIDVVIDDIDIDRFRSMMWEDGSWSVGARLARVDRAGNLGIHMEFQHVGLTSSMHSIFTSGLTVERHLLGSALGPHANGATLGVDWETSARNIIFLEGSIERRSNDPYITISGSPPQRVRTGIRPKELRWRARAAWEHRPGSGMLWSLRFEGGYENVNHFAFSPGANRHHLLARTVIQARLP